MGMFGMLYALFSAGNYAINNVFDIHYNKKAKDRAVINGKDSYFTRDGQIKSVVTNEVCFSYINPNTGDKCLKDVKGNIVRNYSEERRLDRKLKAIKEHKTAYLLTEPGQKYPGKPYKELYKDLETGELYMVKNERGLFFYVDINNYHIVRMTDEQKDDYDKNKERNILYKNSNIEEIIKLYNNYVDEYKGIGARIK